MKLTSIDIENFRSVINATIPIEAVGGSFTYTLIGINESGKSNILRAIFLNTRFQSVKYPEDYFDDTKEIKVALTYTFEPEDHSLVESLMGGKGIDEQIIKSIQLQKVRLETSFLPEENATLKYREIIDFYQNRFPNFTIRNEIPSLKLNVGSDDEIDLDLNNYFLENRPKAFSMFVHDIVSWKADQSHLINGSINLASFAADPETVSIPLKNCFELAGVSDIPAAISKLKASPSEVSNLQTLLSDKVTNHIRKIWPEHEIKIKFLLSETTIVFLIEDNDVPYAARTLDQRSEGFKQFISFLLTISAENANRDLMHTILLLDEPETHLHPRAQESLMSELIKLTNEVNDNVVIYATHSNYLIDKGNLGRCHRVSKGEASTLISVVGNHPTTYSEVNFEIFQIASNDYHNELYGFLEEVDKSALNSLETSKSWYNLNSKKTEQVSLPKYIRHSIHHPENSRNAKFSEEELVESIEILRKAKQKLDSAPAQTVAET